MGCDIHMYLEYELWENSDGTPYWSCIVENAGDRNYTLFGWLANVRSEPPHLIVPPRGLPDDMSYRTKSSALLSVSDKLADTHEGDKPGSCLGCS